MILIPLALTGLILGLPTVVVLFEQYYDQEKSKYIQKWTYTIFLAILLYLAYRYKK